MAFCDLQPRWTNKGVFKVLHEHAITVEVLDAEWSRSALNNLIKGKLFLTKQQGSDRILLRRCKSGRNSDCNILRASSTCQSGGDWAQPWLTAHILHTIAEFLRVSWDRPWVHMQWSSRSSTPDKNASLNCALVPRVRAQSDSPALGELMSRRTWSSVWPSLHDWCVLPPTPSSFASQRVAACKRPNTQLSLSPPHSLKSSTAEKKANYPL